MAGGNGAPGRAAPQIRYALSQLRSRNGHQDFEHLCRELARLRITPNLLPATGPVSVGGDQGPSFETFHAYMQHRPPGSFLASDKGLRIVCACTLQRKNLTVKIKDDLLAIMRGGRVDHVYFFCEQDIPVARRHRLRKWAQQDHGIDIEIIDGQALSELLAAEDCLWIAERYLGIEVLHSQTNPSPNEHSAGLFNGTAGVGIGVGTVHGGINIYHAGASPATPPGTRSEQRRPPARTDGSRKRRPIIMATLIAVAAAAIAFGLILTPQDRSSSPQSPHAVLDDIAAKEWHGPISFDGTLPEGGNMSIQVTISIDSSPSNKPGDRVGWILYGTGCPRAPLTLIRNDQKTLTLTSISSPQPLLQQCGGHSAVALYLSVGYSPKISIMLTGEDPRAGISILAASAKSGTIYKGTLHTSN